MDNEVLTIETPLVLNWRPLPDGVDAVSLRSGNRLTFSLLETGHESGGSHHETHSHSSPELQRIENKLNLLIEMVARLAGNGQTPNLPATLRLSRRSVQWWSDQAPPDAPLLLDLYLETELPHGLRIIARPELLETRNGRYRIGARFESLDEYEENQLEKWIFARHRRMVAQARSRGQGITKK